MYASVSAAVPCLRLQVVLDDSVLGAAARIAAMREPRSSICAQRRVVANNIYLLRTHTWHARLRMYRYECVPMPANIRVPRQLCVDMCYVGVYVHV